MSLFGKIFGKSDKDNLREALHIIRGYYLKYPLQMLDITCSCSRDAIEKAILNLLHQRGLNTKYLLYKYKISVIERGLFANYKEFVNSRNEDLKNLFSTTARDIEWAIQGCLKSNDTELF